MLEEIGVGLVEGLEAALEILVGRKMLAGIYLNFDMLGGGVYL